MLVEVVATVVVVGQPAVGAEVIVVVEVASSVMVFRTIMQSHTYGQKTWRRHAQAARLIFTAKFLASTSGSVNPAQKPKLERAPESATSVFVRRLASGN